MALCSQTLDEKRHERYPTYVSFATLLFHPCLFILDGHVGIVDDSQENVGLNGKEKKERKKLDAASELQNETLETDNYKIHHEHVRENEHRCKCAMDFFKLSVVELPQQHAQKRAHSQESAGVISEFGSKCLHCKNLKSNEKRDKENAKCKE